MEMICARADSACALEVLVGGLHALQAYCSTGAILYLLCTQTHSGKSADARWRRGHVTRGVASASLCATWVCAAAAAALRPDARPALAAALLALPAWLATAVLHALLERRRAPAALLAAAAYWLLCACAAAARLLLLASASAAASARHVRVPLEALALLLTLLLLLLDAAVLYTEIVGKRTESKKTPNEPCVPYRHNSSNFYSKITFFWLRSLLRAGYTRPLEVEDLGELPEHEQAATHYHKFKTIYQQEMIKQTKESKRPSLWCCYLRTIWPNFCIGGALKLVGDLMALIPALGLSVVVRYVAEPAAAADPSSLVTVDEFIGNGFVMAVIILICSISQGVLSQNSTHLVYVEGIRLRTALQGLIFDKCMKLASWSSAATEPAQAQGQEPLLQEEQQQEDDSEAGLITNLVTQDAYNIMSAVFIGHYIWAIPFKVTVIMYLLYTKLGVSAIVGSAVGILMITPLQFYIGKKMSDNSKEIAKRSDHRITKINEILQGMKMIKLYVWEDLFKEKILNLREVELQLLNKDSFFWGVLTFVTHASTILITVVTFSVYFVLEDQRYLTAVNVFAGLALINQLTVPLFILPVTVLMVVQAKVSTTRIANFMTLPESCNTRGESKERSHEKLHRHNKWNTAFVGEPPEDSFTTDLDKISETEIEDEPPKSGDFNSDEDVDVSTEEKNKVLVRLKNAVFTWGDEGENLATLEIEDIEIPAGKLIMVVGPSGSGKSSLLSAILGEMHLERGDLLWNGSCTTAYAGQTPWMVNAHVRENIVLGGSWSPRRYSQVLRATALRPDLQLLPDGDLTRLGSLGVSLSGGQRARVCVARALYSRARLLALDEPLGALDPALARHVLSRGLVAAARRGRAVVVATNRLDLLHYADLVVVMEEGRIRAYGSPAEAVARSPRLAAGVRAAAARGGGGGAAGGGGGAVGSAARERWLLLRALNKASLRRKSDEEPSRFHSLIRRRGVHGSHYLAELPAEEWCEGAGWSGWARASKPRRARPLMRQLSSPPAPVPPVRIPLLRDQRENRTVRRAISADTSSAALRREASVLRRMLRPPTLKWTPRPIRRLFSSESATSAELADTENKTADETEAESALGDPEDSMGEKLDAAEPLENTGNAGGVQAHVYAQYTRACGAWAPAYCAAALACQALAVAGDCWLARGTAAGHQRDRPVDTQQMTGWLQGYCALCAAGALAAALAQGCAQAAGAAARRTIHERLMHVVLHLPLRFFDETPLGRTLNRFSADVLVLDKKLASATQHWVHFALLCLSAVLVNAAVTPWCLLAAVPICAIYYVLQNIYRRNARCLQRLDAATAAPVVSLLAEARAGAAVVRAGGLQPRLRRQLLQRLDRNLNAFLLLNTTNRWLGIALDLLGSGVVFASLITALVCARLYPSAVPPSLVGLVASYTMLLPAYLAWVVKFRAELDMYMGAVERILHYTSLPLEDYKEDAEADLPADWPSRGEIVFDDVSVRHAPDAAPVLRGISLTITPGEKVAVCGRSGGGKSTLVLCCAGAAEICSGSLSVDGMDIRRVPLRLLRRRLCVLPQDATLFSGTLRENLDPLAVHTDMELWHSLRAAKLADFVSAQPAGLECSVRGGGAGSGAGWGAGWSAGRRARACCARAVLCASRATALLLDEPGAALDARTERVLLEALAETARTRTLITVAHRVSAVCEYDRAVVVESGRLAEAGAPPALLADPTSHFARLLAASRR